MDSYHQAWPVSAPGAAQTFHCEPPQSEAQLPRHHDRHCPAAVPCRARSTTGPRPEHMSTPGCPGPAQP
eukprot:3720966-Rhodomonas_salina.1